jgi:hypothetical protein
MRRAIPLMREDQLHRLATYDFPDWDYMPGGPQEPFEYKESDWGYLDGRLVIFKILVLVHCQIIAQAIMLVGIVEAGMASRKRMPWEDEPKGWLDSDANRDKLKMAGGALAAVVLAGWAFFQWFESHSAQPAKQEATVSNQSIFHVCRGDPEVGCRQHDVYIGCGNLSEWADNKCAHWSSQTITDWGGGKCSYAYIRLTCEPR